MFGRMIKGWLGGRSAPAKARTPALPETLQLESGAGARIIVPGGDDGFASLVNSSQGLFIINRYDLGVGWQLRKYNEYDAEQMHNLTMMARTVGPGGVFLDVGANIGVATVLLARVAGPAGRVHAFEAQRPIFHMLAGTLALNGIDNTHCHFQAVGACAGTARVPCLDYREQTSFGSVELNRAQQSDAQQQAKDGQFEEVPMNSIDAMSLERVDLMKIDVEGMEADVLAGAATTIRAHRPLIYLEYMKGDKAALWQILHDESYDLYDVRDNFVCVPQEHPGKAALIAGMRPWSPES
jgi:FkbM family methyltransferase